MSQLWDKKKINEKEEGEITFESNNSPEKINVIKNININIFF